ncbi:MAG TPA: membrane protein insertion efficiency factor YidD [Candidatus Marinimicrobia bacterium]|nr:membrane protein insertion efficiency factor YidD [Candidatus Neomarinimicrobiota bacterium]
MKLLTYPVILLIKFYQKIISPLTPATCRFQPTCSQYSIEALQKHGIFYGLFLMSKRILNCHPWGKSGYDPVP